MAHNAMIDYVGAKTLLTVEQFAQLPEGEAIRYELDQGELIEASGPTYQHNRIRGKIETALNLFLAEQPLGEAVAEQEFRISKDTVRRPDVAFIRREAATRIDKSRSILDRVPDLVIEIVSPNDTAEQVMRRVGQYLAHGSRAVWVVYPVERKILAYGPNDEVRALGEGKNLEASAVLPGFSMAVSRIFE